MLWNFSLPLNEICIIKKERLMNFVKDPNTHGNKISDVNQIEKDESEIKPRVLVVDDDPHTRRTIFQVLHSEFDVTLVESGDKAIEILNKDPEFHVVSLDMQMPGLSGIDTLKALKNLSPATEVLMLTAYSNVDYLKNALKYGAYDYIDKPFDNRALRLAVREGVKRRERKAGAKKAEKQLALVKAQLIESEKFSIIGQLIAGVTHELNNPLTAILGFSELALMNDDLPNVTRDQLEKINKSAILCKNIVQKLLTFSRKNESKREPVDINSVIESSFDLIKLEIKRTGTRVITGLADNLPLVIADFSELQQVFLNLINNALQAMEENEEKGVIEVTSEFDERYVSIQFQDNGPGIPKDHLQKIFEPLYTTKKEGEGTGLGLSICYEIVEEFGGSIYVGSREGTGACFVVKLPITKRGQ
jgi:signal transduction histidine kinase